MVAKILDLKNLPLDQALERDFLEQLSLEQLETIQNNMVTRAAKIIGEIESYIANSDFAKKQFQNLLFNTEIADEKQNVVFKYSCQPKNKDSNFFIPGPWFKPYLTKLEQFKMDYQNNVCSFAEVKRNKLIERLTGKITA